MELTSSAFSHDTTIPPQYTCDGQNISPPLSWTDIPAGTKSFVLIMDDPDAPSGVWDHWILFNIPKNVTKLIENLTTLPNGTQTGNNSWHKVSYSGPCPPDREHRYVFKLYALDTVLPLSNGATKQQVEAKMAGHILAEAFLIGRYNRQ